MKFQRSRMVILVSLLAAAPLAMNVGCGSDENTFTTKSDAGSSGGKDSGPGFESDSGNDASRADTGTPVDAGDSGASRDGGNIDGGNVDAGPAVHTVRANVQGLAAGGGGPAQGLVLRNNGADDLPVVRDGATAFNQRLANGAPYDVTVYQQPNGRNCTVTNGRGTIPGADVTVDVRCTTVATYTVGGTVSGLVPAGGGQPALGLVVQNNGADDTPIVNDGDFRFTREAQDGASYNVTVRTSANGRTCTVANGTGNVQGAAVTSVRVTCTTP